MPSLPQLAAASILALSLGSPLFLGQDGQDETPFVSREDKARLELEAGLEGTWQLTRYEVPDKLYAGADALNGWLMARDGYLSWTMYGSEEVSGFFGKGAQANLESILFRYRVSRTLRLQMASVRGFSDLAETNGLVFDDGHNALDYDILIQGRSLTLNNPGVERYTFRKLARAEFPARAIDALSSETDLDSNDDER